MHENTVGKSLTMILSLYIFEVLESFENFSVESKDFHERNQGSPDAKDEWIPQLQLMRLCIYRWR